MLDSLLQNLYAVPSGGFIAALGLLVAVVSLFRPTERRWFKALLIFFFFSLTVVEMVVLKHQQDVSQGQYTALLTHFQQVETTLNSLLVAQQRLARIEARPKAITPESTLKQRAATLSVDILNFLVQRNSNEPSLPRPETWGQDTDRMLRYFKGTMDLYSKQFGARVIAIRNQFAQQGLTDKELDQFYEHPTNPIGIRIVGERIGALAEQLP